MSEKKVNIRILDSVFTIKVPNAEGQKDVESVQNMLAEVLQAKARKFGAKASSQDMLAILLFEQAMENFLTKKNSASDKARIKTLIDQIDALDSSLKSA